MAWMSGWSLRPSSLSMRAHEQGDGGDDDEAGLGQRLEHFHQAVQAEHPAEARHRVEALELEGQRRGREDPAADGDGAEEGGGDQRREAAACRRPARRRSPAPGPRS